MTPETIDGSVGKAVCGRYLVEKKIGAGSFGAIYSGRDMKLNVNVAIKVETKEAKHSLLEYESQVYQFLSISPHIPEFHCFFKNGEDRVLVMELMGPSLEDLFKTHDRRFSLKTVLMLADQMIKCLEFLHYKNFVHRDVKPDNFVTNVKCPERISVIDFGLAKRYRKPGVGTHIPFRDKKHLSGTARYASTNIHKGYEASRRDDMESLGYVLVYLLRGCLPWQGLKGINKNDKYRKIQEKKSSISVEELCKNLPPEFSIYFHHIKSLRFEDKPDYDFLRKMFKNVMQRYRYKKDHVYDWTELRKETDVLECVKSSLGQ